MDLLRRPNRAAPNQLPLKWILIMLIVGLTCFKLGSGQAVSSFSPSKTNSRSSFDTAPWNDFARVVCKVASGKWQEMGDALGDDWRALEDIHDSRRGSEKNCRVFLEKC